MSINPSIYNLRLLKSPDQFTSFTIQSLQVDQLDWRVQLVIQKIKADLQKQYQLEELAQAVDLSPRQMERLFKTATGSALRQYLKKIRLEKASELLGTTFLSVKEISAQVGLNAINHFVADFKEVYGWTPVEYRNLRQSTWRDVVSRL